MAEGDRDLVLARLTALCADLERRDVGMLALAAETGMDVSIEWVERRTPVLREMYAVAGVEAWEEQGQVVIQHKLTQRVLKSGELEDLLTGVAERVGLMGSRTLAYRTAVEVMSGRESRFDVDDDMWRLAAWGVLGYWARSQDVEPSMALFAEAITDYTFALRERFNGGTLDPFAAEGDYVLTDGGVARVGPDGELSLLMDPEFNVPRLLKESVIIATAEAALIAAGVR